MRWICTLLLAAGAMGSGGSEAHWAYQAPAAPSLEGGRHPVDELIERKLADAGIPSAKEAGRKVLERRAWHLLTGLLPPPHGEARLPTEVPTGEWITKTIDQALASPHFGERWGRHWLDVARYADTKGYHFTGGRRYPYAFAYRDWVIGAFNRDLAFDEFVRRQIAADLMDLPKTEWAALGFLTVGRRFLGRHDLIIGDRIDVVFRGTMGLTMQCVRCHDHKDDPLTMSDYYGIYGILASAEEPRELPVIRAPGDTPGYRDFVAELTKRANAAHDFAAEKIEGYQRPADPLVFDRQAAKRKLNQGESGKYDELIARMTELEASSPHAPVRAMVLRESPKPVEPVIFDRGDPGSHGAAVPRAFPEFFRRNPGGVYTEGSGRRQLAADLTSRGNPLTARVWANRVWMHLMGEPLVATPGDFGVQAPKPLHHDLLDHLAVYLMDHGWSTKALIRHVMTSGAWRRSSSARDEEIAADPENKYYGRSNKHRKELEAWRDTMLQVSGRLSPEVGGRPVAIHQSPYPPRRTIYGFIERQNLPSFFRVFDFPESNQPTVRRAVTTTPNQALYLMNSPFVHAEARGVVKACGVGPGEPPSPRGVDRLYQQVLRRAPTVAERQRAMEFLRVSPSGSGQTAGAWSYGHGHLDPATGAVSFSPLPHFTGSAWQGGPRLPDSVTGWVTWNADGGHPGHGDHAAILRWVSPVDGRFSVEGTIERPGEVGDGVRAVVAVGGRIAGRWDAGPASKVRAELDALDVKAGQAVDFVVESRGNEEHDTFHWAPVIRLEGEATAFADAREGFSGPALEPWAQLAQTLLLSNEFMFVD